MSIDGRRILVTGAGGGIGRCVALELGSRGARLALLDRDEGNLRETAEAVERHGGHAVPLVADLSDLDRIPSTVDDAVEALGGLDVLVNNAGVLSFRPFEEESVASLAGLHTINVVAPMVLAREAARRFRRQGSGRIVNVGSIFGSIGFAYFASYSASKFAIRGFSEALRRELRGTGVGVTYVAPRATRTRLADVFGRMAQAVGMKMDAPELVAKRIVRAVERGDADRYLGFPECVFVRVNALLPRLVDRAVAKQDQLTRPFAEEAAGRAAPQGEAKAPTNGAATPPEDRSAPRPEASTCAR